MSLFDLTPLHRGAYGELVEPTPVAKLNPTVHPADVKRLNEQHTAVIEALRTGPKTTVELNAVAFRFGARLLELTKAGYVWTKARQSDGMFLYTMIREPSGFNASGA